MAASSPFSSSCLGHFKSPAILLLQSHRFVPRRSLRALPWKKKKICQPYFAFALLFKSSSLLSWKPRSVKFRGFSKVSVWSCKQSWTHSPPPQGTALVHSRIRGSCLSEGGRRHTAAFRCCTERSRARLLYHCHSLSAATSCSDICSSHHLTSLRAVGEQPSGRSEERGLSRVQLS